MERMTGLVVLTVALVAGTIATSQESKAPDTKATGRFMACENYSGGGFYWVDTTAAKIWWATTGKEKIEWKYIGQGKDAKGGENGTYIPFSTKNSGGLYILNTITGGGWWTNGKDWTVVDKPSDAVKTEQKDSTGGTVPSSGGASQPKEVVYLIECVVHTEAHEAYEVMLDGKLVGSGKVMPTHQQVVSFTATPGEHELVAKAPGLETFQKKITVTKGANKGQQFFIDLKRPAQ